MKNTYSMALAAVLATCAESAIGQQLNCPTNNLSTCSQSGYALSITNTSGGGAFIESTGTGASSAGLVARAANTSSAPALRGISSLYNGVEGLTGGTGTSGVYGSNSNCSGYGVAGRNKTAGACSGAAVYGDGANTGTGAWAGYFNGDVHVTGFLTVAGSKGFLMDHPVEPAEKYLLHLNMESSEAKNLYDGIVTLNSLGDATIALPAWFEAVNGSFRYQLTSIGGPSNAYISREFQGGSFSIGGGTPGQKISWQITGVRKDPEALANRLPVEIAKPASERGKYLSPHLYGKPDSLRLETFVRPR